MPLAVIRTNLSKASVPNNLMETVSAFMVKMLESDEKVCLFSFVINPNQPPMHVYKNIVKHLFDRGDCQTTCGHFSGLSPRHFNL